MTCTSTRRSASAEDVDLVGRCMSWRLAGVQWSGTGWGMAKSLGVPAGSVRIAGPWNQKERQ